MDQQATMNDGQVSTNDGQVSTNDDQATTNDAQAAGGSGLGTAALNGALAAIAGGLVMKAVWQGGERMLAPDQRLGSPTRGAVDALAQKRGAALSDRQRTLASLALYTGAMATWGAVYGMVHSKVRPPAALHGLVLGSLLYAANFTPRAALPKAGIVPAFGGRSPRQRAVPIGAHAAFGLATAATFEALS